MFPTSHVDRLANALPKINDETAHTDESSHFHALAITSRAGNELRSACAGVRGARTGAHGTGCSPAPPSGRDRQSLQGVRLPPGAARPPGGAVRQLGAVGDAVSGSTGRPMVV